MAQNDAEFTNFSSSGSQFNGASNDSDSWATFQQTDTTIPSITPAVSVVSTQIIPKKIYFCAVYD